MSRDDGLTPGVLAIMSMVYYATRVYWSDGRGAAKLRGGAVLVLKCAPHIDSGGAIIGLEYTPEVGVRRIQRRFEGWRDMERDEIKACDEWLLAMMEERP